MNFHLKRTLRPGSRTYAAIWGFTEATLFFIVPDVLLSSLALTSLKKALLACIWASLAAALGGITIWLMISNYPQETKALLLWVPGISQTTFNKVGQLLSNGTYSGMVVGAFTGVPYKIFAAEAGSTNLNPVLFLLLSPLARLPRFAVIVLVTWSLSRLTRGHMSNAAMLALCLTLWILFYVFYFAMVGW
ncbi:hypothetical protein FIV00_12435 [Labrenzia sp. THAF82]|nr:hypothetical protein FIV00_12435 [Labrenzia sp. THAF82]